MNESPPSTSRTQGSSRAFPAPRLTESVTEPVAVSETGPPLASPRLAELLDKAELDERNQREEERLACLGRLAAFD